jgi:hypothetical protein
MRKLILLLACAAASGLAAATADAQPTETRSFNNSPSDVALLMQGLASCIGASQPQVVETILAIPLLSQEQSLSIAQSLSNGNECMRQVPATLKFQAPALVGGLAEEMFLSRYGEKDTKWIVAQNAIARPRNQPEDLALCIVGRNPRVTRALLDSVPASNEERMLATKLAADLGSCLPAGMTLSFVPSNVRTFAAAGLYLSSKGTAAQPTPAR